MMERGGV